VPGVAVRGRADRPGVNVAFLGRRKRHLQQTKEAGWNRYKRRGGGEHSVELLHNRREERKKTGKLHHNRRTQTKQGGRGKIYMPVQLS